MFDALSGKSGLGFLTLACVGVLATVAYFRKRRKRFESQQVTLQTTQTEKEVVIKGLCSEIKAHRVWYRGRDV